MSQDYTATITGSARNALKTLLPNNDEALRSRFSGSTEPANPVPYQLWADTANGLEKERNAANSAWIVRGPLGGNAGRLVLHLNLGTVNATANSLQLWIPANATVVRVALISDTTSTGSVAATTEYQWQLRNLTTSVNLFSATVGTGTVLAGVGGGEITLNTPYYLLANQNADVAAGDRLQFQITKVGSPTSLTSVVLYLDLYERG